jgi:hypothetical protein
MKVTYNRRLRLATFSGEGGRPFTQIQMQEIEAEAIATVFAVPFEIEDPA